MTIRIMVGLLAATFGVAALQSPATAVAVQPSSTTRQCRLEVPAQYGPRAPLKAAQMTCPAVKEACGRYELYWPHWISERALPPVKRWVAERC